MGLVEQLYASVFDPGGVYGFLPSLFKAFDDASGIVHVFDAHTQTTPEFFAFGMDTATSSAYASHYTGLNPYPAEVFVRSEAGAVLRSIDILPAEEAERTEFVADWMIPNRMGAYHLGSVLQHDAAGMTLLAMSTSHQLGKANLDKYVADLKCLTPHLVQAIALERRFRERARLAAVGESLLELIDVPALVLDEYNRVVMLNSLAETNFEAKGILRLTRSSPLKLQNGRADAELQAAVYRLRTTGEPTCVRLELWPHSYGIWVLKLPSSPSAERDLAGRSPHVKSGYILLLIVRPDQAAGARTGPQTLRILFGLSPAEAEVAARIGSALSLEDTAEELGVSKVTARNQLASAMGKIGLSRQAELVALVASLKPKIATP